MTESNAQGKNAPQSEDYDAEWKSCLESTTKFDGYLIDLRKYGFSLLTSLTAGSSFLGFASPSQILQIGVIIVTMILVVVLYWVDVYYQNLLYGSVLRSRFLELFRLNRGLSNYVSGLAGNSTLPNTLPFLYGGFIIGLLILGMIVIFNAHCNDIISTGNMSKDPNACFVESISRIPIVTILLIGAALITFVLVLSIFFLEETERMRRVNSMTSLFSRSYDIIQKLTDNHEKKKVADSVEKKLMIMLL